MFRGVFSLTRVKFFCRMCTELGFPTYKLQKTIWGLIKMATREENLKKINEELEKLSDEELEGVAGGTRLENYTDGHELYKRGLLAKKMR